MRRIYFFHVEEDVFSISMRDRPSIIVSVQIAHITCSPVKKKVYDAVWRCILMSYNWINSKLPKLSPVLLLVDDACDFNVLLVFLSDFFKNPFKVKTGFEKVTLILQRVLMHKSKQSWDKKNIRRSYWDNKQHRTN